MQGLTRQQRFDLLDARCHGRGEFGLGFWVSGCGLIRLHWSEGVTVQTHAL